MESTYHYWVGNAGHFFIILSFVASLVAAFGFLKASLSPATADGQQWRNFAQKAFYLHSFSVVCVVATLFYMIFQHYFEYHYAWSHSSKALPVYYMIACFWESQEGSFLLWIFWHAFLGLVLIGQGIAKEKKGIKDSLQSPIMTIFSVVQVFLGSMILGVVFFDTLKIGSSPFLLLKEAMPELPVWQMQANFIPKDGNGLNPLLQNYWMVIHPPTLFLGFATTLVPFAYAIAGLWQGQYKEWIKPALPWALFSALVLGIGIVMGAYWAYETLNFGGYWNWDPVENAVYVPWLVMVAAIHTMIIYKNNKTALKTSIILIISQFILILYATFLTRSGVLGNASVHSFTDLGLSGQLLIYLLFFVVVAVGFMVAKWKYIPSDAKELSTYTREFWIFCGATVLCLAAFQVIVTTSIPVYNKIIEAFGYVSKLALPVDQIGHYSKFQIWFFTFIVIFSSIAQYFWWNKAKAIKSAKLETVSVKGFSLQDFNLGVWEAFSTPLVIAFVSTALIITLTKVTNWIYIVLLTACVFSLVCSATVLWDLLRKQKAKISGGAVTHIGVALMLIGIMYSSGYSKVISLNNTGLLISNAEVFTANNNQENKENVMLWLNKPSKMGDYLLTYKGQRIEARQLSGYLHKEDVEVLPNDFRALAKKDIMQDGQVKYKQGDTLAVFTENTFYEIEYREPSGRIFTLFPKAQVNPKMGLLASPDIHKTATTDLYTHVSYVNDPTGEVEWSKAETHVVALQDTFFVNDYVAILENVGLDTSNKEIAAGEAAVKAQIRVLDKDNSAEISPVYVLNSKTGMVKRSPVIDMAVGLKVRFESIDPKTGQFTFTTQTTQKEFVVMKALEKPFINLLWIGVIVLIIGFVLAIKKERLAV